MDTVDAPLAAVISTGDADHTDCQERIQELEAKIERLEQQLVDGDITPAAAVTVRHNIALSLCTLCSLL